MNKSSNLIWHSLRKIFNKRDFLKVIKCKHLKNEVLLHESKESGLRSYILLFKGDNNNNDAWNIGLFRIWELKVSHHFRGKNDSDVLLAKTWVNQKSKIDSRTPLLRRFSECSMNGIILKVIDISNFRIEGLWPELSKSKHYSLRTMSQRTVVNKLEVSHNLHRKKKTYVLHAKMRVNLKSEIDEGYCRLGGFLEGNLWESK